MTVVSWSFIYSATYDCLGKVYLYKTGMAKCKSLTQY